MCHAIIDVCYTKISDNFRQVSMYNGTVIHTLLGALYR